MISRHLAFIYEVATTFLLCAEEAKELQHELPMAAENKHKVFEELNAEVFKAEAYV